MTARAEHRLPVMADVAKLAGVSHQTVSRVINGHPSLRPATRERVEDAIRELGYRPNSVARALVTRRSATVGVISTTNGAQWGPSTVLRAIQSAARESGYHVSPVHLSSITHDDLAAAIDHLRDHHVEGIIMIVAHDEAIEIARQQETGGLPVVVVEGDLSRAPWTVGVDQLAGSRMATEHLLSLGHRRIAHVAGPLDWVEARARLQGWREALSDAGIAAPEPLLGDWTAESGYAAGLELAEHYDVTAVFVANDHMAIGLLRALSEAGMRVPEDISVVGFDDIPESGYLIPPLTTVRQDFDAVGSLAIDTLQVAIRVSRRDASIDGGGADRGRLINPELVLRSSTGPARPTAVDGVTHG